MNVHDKLIAQAQEDLDKSSEVAAQVSSANLGKMDAGMVLSLINVRTQAVQALALARIAKMLDQRAGGVDFNKLRGMTPGN